MKIIRAFLNILLWVVSLLITINFIRIVISGGDTDFLLTFRSFVDVLMDVDFDLTVFFNDFLSLFEKASEVSNVFAGVKSSLWSGTTIIGKILSLLTSFYNLFVGFVNFLVGIVASFAKLLADIAKIFKALLDLIGKLIGSNWLVSA